MAYSKQDYINSLKIIEEYVSQIEESEITLKSLNTGDKVIMERGSNRVFYIQEIDKTQILVSTSKNKSDLKYDDFWIHYSEIKSIQDAEDIRSKLSICPICEGKGWSLEHDPNDPHTGGVCTCCPVQVQCEPCQATGLIWKKDIKPENKVTDYHLPF